MHYLMHDKKTFSECKPICLAVSRKSDILYSVLVCFVEKKNPTAVLFLPLGTDQMPNALCQLPYKLVLENVPIIYMYIMHIKTYLPGVFLIKTGYFKTGN